MRKIELLAPAGSFEVMRACLNAGADAIYMGLSKFSARAYAENEKQDDYVEAIHYTHELGKKLYCTVNTLMKERELRDELYDTLKPLYEAGLDAVIVQDFGAISLIHELFPDLPIHVSTQAVVTGPGAVRFLREFGITRVVPARELNLNEIRRIYDETGIEIETFIHGALCYCYSGECLFSSVVGGRSGNRGRCAQPCRMPYALTDEKGQYISKKSEPYLLSLKDLNTLEMLPEILESGVCSLKIEGRMKKAEYAAGVTSIYRKYLDLYLANPDGNYRVSREDEARLFSLFNRDGFTDGYYKRKNGREMMALTEKEFRKEDEAFLNELRENVIRVQLKKPVSCTYEFTKGQPLKLTYTASYDGFTVSGTAVSEKEIQDALTKGVEKSDLESRLGKTGDTLYAVESVSGTCSDSAFLQIGEINETRRKALASLKEAVLNHFGRTV